MRTHRHLQLAVGLAISALIEITGCGGSAGGGTTPPPPTTYTIGGTVSGLTGTGLVLQDNGGNNLAVSASGSFTFSTAVASGAAYSVTVLTQPTGQSCTVTNGSGTASANVTNVQVACSNLPPTTYTIGGTVSGLTGTGLVLQDNGGNNLAVSASGSFTFSTAVASGSTYSVTVLTQPTGQSCTVTNGSGTASANVTNVQVACSNSVVWTNKTSYVPTRATPYSAVYDSVHGMIYSANQVWNRVDVISDATRKIVKSIFIRDPRGMDLSIDGSTVWVATGSPVMYGINTTTQQATLYQLPPYKLNSASSAISWEGITVFALADGTVLLETNMQLNEPVAGGNSFTVLIWNPSTNSFTQPSTFASAPWGVIARSGNGKIVFSAGMDEAETSFTYNVATQAISTPVQLSSFGYASQVAVNTDGSRVAITTLGTQPFGLYDGSLNLIGTLPGDGGAEAFPPLSMIYGGSVFSAGRLIPL